MEWLIVSPWIAGQEADRVLQLLKEVLNLDAPGVSSHDAANAILLGQWLSSGVL